MFANINPHGVPRVWRVGEDFETVARQFLPRAKPYRLWQARVLNALHVTKSLRSEYDHLMLQLHDLMKLDEHYQRSGGQVSMPFAAGSAWVCFSDQATHAVMSGQFMVEQTLHLPPGARIVIFHGEVNPPDALVGKRNKRFAFIKPALWVADAWQA